MKSSLKKRAIDLLTKYPDISNYEFAKILNIDVKQVRNIIKKLLSNNTDDELNKLRVNRKQKKSTNTVLKGTVCYHKEGYGFFIPEDKNIEDAFIHPVNLNGAFHNDKCLARISMYRHRREAEIIEIIERGVEQVIGIIVKHRGSYRIIPFSKNFQNSIVIKNNNNEFVEDDIVLCRLETYPEKNKKALGKIIEKIGTLHDRGIDNKIVMYKYALSTDFPREVMHECLNIENGNFKIRKKGLTDFRNIYTVTIDGETARDYDDAISVLKENDDYILYVHIADVSRYVERGSYLNKEAIKRGTSVYFPEFAINMLPETLSNGVCSLVPFEDRYTVTCKMVFDKQGQKKEVSFYRSIINSNKRLTYNYVNNVLSNKVEDVDDDLLEFLFIAKELSDILLMKREINGVIDFDLPEAEFTFDDEGNIIDINPQERGYSERLIECFMIAANESVAEFFEKKQLKGIYRVHGKPDTKKIDDWIKIAKRFGLKIPLIENPITPEYIAELSKIAMKSKHTDILSALLIRSMMRAEYTTDNQGHFGLASQAYTHFTSPIRRYPDLLVHRALLSGLGLGNINEPLEELKELASHCSKMERVSQEATNDIDSFKKLEYLSNNYSQIFEAYINNINSYGLFIYIEKLMMTGYIDYSYIDFDVFSKQGDIAVGTTSAIRYKVGDKVQVMLYKINISQLQADFTLCKNESNITKSAKKKKKKSSE